MEALFSWVPEWLRQPVALALIIRRGRGGFGQARRTAAMRSPGPAGPAHADRLRREADRNAAPPDLRRCPFDRRADGGADPRSGRGRDELDGQHRPDGGDLRVDGRRPSGRFAGAWEHGRRGSPERVDRRAYVAAVRQPGPAGPTGRGSLLPAPGLESEHHRLARLGWYRRFSARVGGAGHAVQHLRGTVDHRRRALQDRGLGQSRRRRAGACDQDRAAEHADDDPRRCRDHSAQRGHRQREDHQRIGWAFEDVKGERPK